jgi:hypothetical protein
MCNIVRSARKNVFSTCTLRKYVMFGYVLSGADYLQLALARAYQCTQLVLTRAY